IWFSTLKTRANLAVMWDAESPQMQHLLQERVRSSADADFTINADLIVSGIVADI
ncbi:MAG: hypothetical protein Q9180_005172, partial [Flavoplaca navasiana]